MQILTALLLAPQLVNTPGVEAPETYDPRFTPEVRVVQEVSPSVVFIETGFNVRVRTWFGIESRPGSGSGSGVVIFDDGYIVTNYHVVKGADEIKVHFDPTYDERVYAADLISAEPEEDLALLKITREEPFPTVTMGTSSDLMIGERVLAIGNPYGQSNTVSAGIISGLHRDVDVPPLKFKNLIQTDASINPGNSGGPLLNIKGELIGINSVMKMGAENIGFAIPVNQLKKVLEDQLLDLAAAPGWLGFEIDLERLELTHLAPDSPAAEAGLRPGDIIVAIGEKRVANGDEYRLARLAAVPGRGLPVSYVRDGRESVATLEPWRRVDGILYDRLGITVKAVTIGSRLPVSVVSVERVREGGPGSKLGLRPGDFIDGVQPRQRRAQLVRTPEEFALLVQRTDPGVGLELNVWRDENGNGLLERSPEYSELFRGRLTLE